MGSKAIPIERRERDVNSWEEFEEQLREIRAKVKSQLFFRGQSNSTWPLSSTLDREPCGARTFFKDYYHSISKAATEIESLTSKEWDIPDYPTVEKWVTEYDEFSRKLSFGQFPAYSYMVHLRHHGFPSPLLDWSRSPYVAAYFAFCKVRNNTAQEAKVSIHVFSEPRFRLSGNRMPLIFRLGQHVKTHRRHFLQQCDYTLCVLFSDEWRFAEYQEVFDYPNQSQWRFWKFNIPYSARAKVLKRLDQHNLNAFSLFGSEESLMDTMALRTWHFGEDSIPEEEKREMATDLAEVKAEAAKRGYTRIRRDVENAPWVPLESWRGFSGSTDVPYFTVQVEYWLEGDKIRVTRALDDQEYSYTLS
jgi:FRG domain